jgi:sRNA-binding carbon storage regulator CsrA
MHVCKYKINETIFIGGDDGIGIALILSNKVNIKLMIPF